MKNKSGEIRILHVLKIANTKFDNGYDWLCYQLACFFAPLFEAWEKA